MAGVVREQQKVVRQVRKSVQCYPASQTERVSIDIRKIILQLSLDPVKWDQFR